MSGGAQIVNLLAQLQRDFGLTYLFVVATNFLTNLEAFVTIMIVTATPWMVIVGLPTAIWKVSCGREGGTKPTKGAPIPARKH